MDSQHTSVKSNAHNPREEILSRLSRGAWAKQFLIEAIVDETACDREAVLKVLDQLQNAGRIYVFNGIVKQT
jgi:hypothetical protein